MPLPLPPPGLPSALAAVMASPSGFLVEDDAARRHDGDAIGVARDVFVYGQA